MQSQNEIEPKLVIAIDFGTYASGFALQWRTGYEAHNQNIYCNQWGAGHFQTYKTVTCLLLKPDKTFAEFGHKAEERYSELGTPGEDEDEKHDDWYFFRQFKMALYNQKDVNETTVIKDETNKPLTLIEVFTPSIKYMKDEAINYLDGCGLTYIDDRTKWVLTVPAIWDDNMKQVMRSSAEKAGIQGQYLTIALEPECAGLYCKQIPADQLTLMHGVQPKYIGEPGSTFIVVDIGGGTVDITALEVEKDGTMKQVAKSDGGPWGGKKINDRFFEMLETIIGPDNWSKFLQQNRLDELQLIRTFELEKRQLKQVKATGKARNFNICIPTELMQYLQRSNDERIKKLMKEGCKVCKIQKSRFVFPIDQITCVFDEVIEGIMNHTKLVVQDIQDKTIKLDALIVVGGLAGSDYVTSGLREYFKKYDIPVLRPQDTELAVLRGAVLFGHNEKIITARVMRYTIGVGMVMKFGSKRNDPDKKFSDEKGVEWARDVFRKHVTIDQEVKTGEWVGDKDYYPVGDNQKTATVYMFSSKATDPNHTTDEGCSYVGNFDISFTEDREAKIEIAMYFSGTEIVVRAIEKKSGKVSFQTLKSM